MGVTNVGQLTDVETKVIAIWLSSDHLLRRVNKATEGWIGSICQDRDCLTNAPRRGTFIERVRLPIQEVVPVRTWYRYAHCAIPSEHG